MSLFGFQLEDCGRKPSVVKRDFLEMISFVWKEVGIELLSSNRWIFTFMKASAPTPLIRALKVDTFDKQVEMCRRIKTEVRVYTKRENVG